MNVWREDRANNKWVGPITITLVINGVTSTPTGVQFALVPKNTRPGDTDWVDPVADPDLSGTVGLNIVPVDAYGVYDVWARYEDSPTIDQLAYVGEIIRT